MSYQALLSKYSRLIQELSENLNPYDQDALLRLDNLFTAQTIVRKDLYKLQLELADW